MEQQYWRQFAIGFLMVNTACVVVLIEVLTFGKPYISLFFLILTLTILFNRKLFWKKK